MRTTPTMTIRQFLRRIAAGPHVRSILEIMTSPEVGSNKPQGPWNELNKAGRKKVYVPCSGKGAPYEKLHTKSWWCTARRLEPLLELLVRPERDGKAGAPWRPHCRKAQDEPPRMRPLCIPCRMTPILIPSRNACVGQVPTDDRA